MSSTSDREFVKIFSGLVGALIALAIINYVIAQMVVSGSGINKKGTAEKDQALVERIKPVGEVAMGAVVNGLVPAASAAGDKGKATFDASCAACHGMGVAGAPKTGDKAAWGPRIAQGNDTLYAHAIKGFQGKAGFMPAKGGNAGLADADVKAAVDFMVSKAK